MNEICKTDDQDLAAKGYKLFPLPNDRLGIVIKTSAGYHAYVNRCPHAEGYTLPFTKDDGTSVLKCQNHGAEFDPDSGARLSGQAPEGSFLRSLALTIENSTIFYQ